MRPGHQCLSLHEVALVMPAPLAAGQRVCAVSSVAAPPDLPKEAHCPPPHQMNTDYQRTEGAAVGELCPPGGGEVEVEDDRVLLVSPPRRSDQPDSSSTPLGRSGAFLLPCVCILSANVFLFIGG